MNKGQAVDYSIRSPKVKKSKSELVASILAELMAAILLVLALVPILHTLSTAFSSGSAEVSGSVYLWPVGFQLEGMKTIALHTIFPKALLNTTIVTVMGISLSMVISILFAYPLSKTYLRGRKVLVVMCIVSMVFAGGMVPSYIVVRSLGLFNRWFSIILPASLNIFNMLIIKNYFESLPDSVMESATIDGAGDLRTLVSIVVPMSTPVIATVSLLYAVYFWNNYFHAMLYINKPAMKTLQVFVYDLINNTQSVVDQLERTEETSGLVSVGVVQAGITILGFLPMLAFYPFIQRYMVGGITIGSVKG